MTKIALTTFCLLGLITTPVLAQETPQTPATPVRNARQQSVEKVAAKIGDDTGAKILVAFGLSQQLVTAPDTAATPATLEDTLTSLTRRLPDATWVKVYLPAPAMGQRYRAETVAQFAQAQLDLAGRPAKTPETVLIAGKRMTLAQAQPLIKDLGLEPYYVLTSRSSVQTGSSDALANLTSGAASRGQLALAALMKQVGVTKPNEIPSGEYDVTVPGDDGTPQKFHMKIENSEGRTSISIGTQTGTP